jgi:hypothetical protein
MLLKCGSRSERLLCASLMVVQPSWPEVRDEGRTVLLRFGDNGSAAWELCEAGKWHEVDWTGWYVEHYEFAANRLGWSSSVRHFDAVTALIDEVRTAGRRDHVRVQPPSKATEAQIDWI